MVYYISRPLVNVEPWPFIVSRIASFLQPRRRIIIISDAETSFGCDLEHKTVSWGDIKG